MEEKINLEVKQIKTNPLNFRSMNDDQIEVMAESIKQVGLLSPLVVYQKGNDYILLSGHRRLEASKKAGLETVPVYVVDKPKSSTREQEILAEANIHRSYPDDIKNEVIIANKIYNTMSDGDREIWKKRLLENFNKKNENNPKFVEDPAKFRERYYRTRLEYIKAITGLDVSNTTVKGLLKDSLEEGEEIKTAEDTTEEEQKETKEKKITRKNVIKAINSLYGLLEIYEADDIDEMFRGEVFDLSMDAKAILEDLRMQLGGE